MNRSVNPARSRDALGRLRSLQVLSEQIRTIVLQTPQGVAGPAALGTISAMLVWPHAPRGPLLAALALLLLSQLFWLEFYRRYRRQEPEPDRIERCAGIATLLTLLHGVAWGAYSLVIFPDDSVTTQSLVVAFMYGLVAGAVVVDGPHFRTFLAFALPTLVPVIVRSAAEGTVSSLGVACAGLVGLSHGVFAAFNASRITVTAIRTQLENQELLQKLEHERKLADAARALAEAANLEKSRFLAAASHDLRQPVHALGLFAEAATRAGSDEERRYIIERIGTSVQALSTLFDSLLEVSRLDSGSLRPELSRLPLQPLLRSVVEEFAADAARRGLSLRCRCPDVFVETDRVLLGRLLGNLVSNALRYTPNGGVLVAARQRSKAVQIGVWDTGIGIAPADHERIFDEFYQLANSERDRQKGTGLGLAIVRRIAALLGFVVRVRSRLGRGSCFSFELPCVEPELGEASADASPMTDEQLLGTVVLVVDDDPVVVQALELLLKQRGCVVCCASSVSEATQQLDAAELVPDVVLSDQRLRGGETALDVLRTLRQQYPGLPAIIVTGDPLASAAAALSADAPVLQKPVNADALTRAIARVLASGRA